LPKLRKLAMHERGRQIALHAATNLEGGPMPGNHCNYCPKLLSSCPLKDANPYAMDPKERLQFVIWAQKAAAEGVKVLKDQANLAPIEVQDANGVTYRAAHELKQSTKYPLEAVYPVLTQWGVEHPADDVRQKLFVGATELKSLAKAKKRSSLAESLTSVAATVSGTEFRIGKVEEAEG
jgi:hypothetical protein